MAEEARLIHIAKMKAFAKREPQVWQEVDQMLETGQKLASTYDQATELLKSLQGLTWFQNTRDGIQYRVKQLAGKYASRPSLIKRWHHHGSV